ncbi:MAG: hypothetical protein OSB46_03585 [Alphaproteobacteria bacterium]|nr:hypothetical protein [Alphaproteobacteria bacterium]
MIVYDEYCHGAMQRWDFLSRAAAMTLVAGGSGLGQALVTRYAEAQPISFTDKRIKARYVAYESPGGNSGKMRDYLVQAIGDGSIFRRFGSNILGGTLDQRLSGQQHFVDADRS